MNFDWVIVGSGLAGSTVAECIAREQNRSVLVVEQREHIGGNIYDEYDDNGIFIQKYGPHIFHTNHQGVWDYLSRFTQWRPYTHRVQAVVEGRLVPLPVNLNSIAKLFPPNFANHLIDALVNKYGFGRQVTILELMRTEVPNLKFLAEYIYKNVFENYTVKQWGVRPEELASSVTERVPIRISRDDRYFQDTYQAIPSTGYTNIIKNMLANNNIKILLNTKWQEICSSINYNRLVFTGCIDEFYDFKHGALPYRSLAFDRKLIDAPRYQDTAVVNFPNDYDYTRITEFKHLTGQEHDKTVIAIEYPQPHVVGKTIPYYPIPTDANKELYKSYSEESKADNIFFLGRLGEYTYYNMDQVVARALKFANKSRG